MSAREAILAAARAARRPVGDALPAFRARDATSPAERRGKLLSRLSDYGVHVVRLSGEAGIAAAAAERLAARDSPALVAAEGLPRHWLPPVKILAETSLSRADLDKAPSVMTTAALAIAETGTIVLDAGPGQGRRDTTLLPDHHICVVFANRIVGIVPEAIEALRPAIDDGRPITFISGPSATADIEFDRVVGVHGPRRLDVLLIDAGEDAAP